jgi:hypothetical protein
MRVNYDTQLFCVRTLLVSLEQELVEPKTVTYRTVCT